MGFSHLENLVNREERAVGKFHRLMRILAMGRIKSAVSDYFFHQSNHQYVFRKSVHTAIEIKVALKYYSIAVKKCEESK